MRLPSDVLDRVRGALVVAALTSCSHETKAPPPPSPSAVTAAVPPVPVDPVSYASASEAERLARLDAEEAADAGARRARLNRLVAQRQQETLDELLRISPGNVPGNTIGIGPLTTGRPLQPYGCNACGRG